MSEQLAIALRFSGSRQMRNRRWIVGLSMFSATVLSGIGLFQLGIVRRLPEPKWGPFDSAKVTGSGEAYSVLQTPDALLGALSYSVTAALAGMGAPDRVRSSPLIPAGMGMKLAIDAAVAITMTTREWNRYRSLCFWCLLTTGATAAAVVLGAPEAVAGAAAAGLRHRGDRFTTSSC